MRLSYGFIFVVLAAITSVAQAPAQQSSNPSSTVSATSNSAAPSSPQVSNDYVKKEFGACTINPEVAPVTADLNGDGVEDIVIAARCKDPMMDADEYKYTVIDPSNAFYGFGNPKITTQYSAVDPASRDLALLIVHGVGADGWRSPQAKTKFLIVNLAYKQIAAKKYAFKKKKSITAIYVEEAGDSEITSVVYWDGKRYKYEPIGAALD